MAASGVSRASHCAVSARWFEPTAAVEQRDILKALGMSRLVEDTEVAERLESRRS